MRARARRSASSIGSRQPAGETLAVEDFGRWFADAEGRPRRVARPVARADPRRAGARERRGRGRLRADPVLAARLQRLGRPALRRAARARLRAGADGRGRRQCRRGQRAGGLRRRRRADSRRRPAAGDEPAQRRQAGALFRRQIRAVWWRWRPTTSRRSPRRASCGAPTPSSIRPRPARCGRRCASAPR